MDTKLYTKHFKIEDRDYEAIRELPTCDWRIHLKNTSGQYVDIRYFVSSYQNDAVAIKQAFIDKIEKSELTLRKKLNLDDKGAHITDKLKKQL